MDTRVPLIFGSRHFDEMTEFFFSFFRAGVFGMPRLGNLRGGCRLSESLLISKKSHPPRPPVFDRNRPVCNPRIMEDLRIEPPFSLTS